MKQIDMSECTDEQVRVLMKHMGLDDDRGWAAYLYGDKPLTYAVRRRFFNLMKRAGYEHVNVSDPNFIVPCK